MRGAVAFIGVTVACCACVKAQQCAQWIERNDVFVIASQSPQAVYDSARDRVVGLFYTSTDMYTGEWDGQAWEFLDVGWPPVPRARTSMAYDSWRGVTVHFGGNVEWMDDTWEWNGAGWRFVPVSGPSSRESHAMAFDSWRGVTVLHGGYTSVNGDRQSDTWEYDGVEWRLVDPVGFGDRTNHAMAFDERRGVIVAVGGQNNNNEVTGDTWEWDGATWTHAAEDLPDIAYCRLVYDPLLERCILVGGDTGSTSYDDVWSWDGLSWTLLPVDGPGRMYYPGAAYHGGTNRIIVFGGNPDTDETWELAISGPPTITDQPQSVAAEAGDTVELFVEAESGSGIAFQWLLDGAAVVDDGRVSGATTDHLTIVDAGWADEGEYTVVVSNDCGSVESNPAMVTVACRADFNTDHAVDTLDVLLFLSAWSSGSQSADFNGDGTVNTLDFLAYLNAWSTGC